MTDKRIILPSDLGKGIVFNPASKQYEVNLDDYVVKGSNGSWTDTIPTSSDLRNPQRVVRFDTTTLNRPSGASYGVAVSFNSLGHYNKVSQNWIPTLAFDTNQKLYLAQSINGGNDDWLSIPTSMVSEHTIKFISSMPVVGATMTVNMPTYGQKIHRNNLVDMRARVDLANSSIMFEGRLEAVINSNSIITGIKLTNTSSFSIPSGRPITFYITYEK